MHQLCLGIYLISETAKKLYFYEDYPILYRKVFTVEDCDEPIFTYVMDPGYGIGPPSKLYFEAGEWLYGLEVAYS